MPTNRLLLPMLRKTRHSHQALRQEWQCFLRDNYSEIWRLASPKHSVSSMPTGQAWGSTTATHAQATCSAVVRDMMEEDVWWRLEWERWIDNNISMAWEWWLGNREVMLWKIVMVRGGVKQDNDMGQRTKGMSTAQLRKGSLDKPAGFLRGHLML